jgi:hypothetical protein
MKNGNEEDQSFKSLSCYQVRWSAVSVCQHGMQTKSVSRTQRPRWQPSGETPYILSPSWRSQTSLIPEYTNGFELIVFFLVIVWLVSGSNTQRSTIENTMLRMIIFEQMINVEFNQYCCRIFPIMAGAISLA